MNRLPSYWLIIVAAEVLSACSTAAVKDADLGDKIQAKALTADYRMVMSRDRASGNTGKIVCTEPSPDVARAVSQAISQNASLTAAYAAQSIGASEAFQYQTAQAIAQLGKRFATIQLLRDELYNQCLAYANGQLSESAYAMKLSRFDALAVTLLGIEMLSGDTGSPLPPVSSPPLTVSNSGTGTANVHLSPSSTSGTLPLKTGPGGKGSADVNLLTASKAVSAVKSNAKTFEDSVSKVDTAAKAGEALPALKKAATSLQAVKKIVDDAVAAVTKAWDSVQGAKPKEETSAAIKNVNKLTPSGTKEEVAKAKQDAAASENSDAKVAMTALDEVIKSLSDASTALARLDSTSQAEEKTPSSDKGASQVAKGAISDEQARMIEQMQANFLQQEQLAPSLLACTSYFDRNPSPSQDNPFAKYCEKLFNERIEFLSVIRQLTQKERIPVDVGIAGQNQFFMIGARPAPPNTYFILPWAQEK